MNNPHEFLLGFALGAATALVIAGAILSNIEAGYKDVIRQVHFALGCLRKEIANERERNRGVEA